MTNVLNSLFNHILTDMSKTIWNELNYATEYRRNSQTLAFAGTVLLNKVEILQ